MTGHVKFVQINRTVDHNTKKHYLDAIDDNGRWWIAIMDADKNRTGEDCLIFTEHGKWRPAYTQPREWENNS
jgi:hypothetical protein